MRTFMGKLASGKQFSCRTYLYGSLVPVIKCKFNWLIACEDNVIEFCMLLPTWYSSTTSSQHSDSRQLAEPSHWDSLNSPLIQDEGDGKSLKLRFDVSQYTPEEIVVKTVDNKLLVHAKHEEKSDTKSVYREYNREFLLPKGTNPEAIKSSLSRDGVLTVEAPLPQLAITDRSIPIQKH